MKDMESPSTKLQKILTPQFLSGNTDPGKVFETCCMFCDELFLEPCPDWSVASETLRNFLNSLCHYNCSELKRSLNPLANSSYSI